ncbi:hypothetical protein ACERII_16600 [Evansella sp. AB-rgal1]|uniref:hypothetical protein n=1 Tax=Evansella sp. AB-rgal1 TaxID=3242696 RepID=UPI00359E04DA
MDSNVCKEKLETELEKTKDKMDILNEVDLKLHQMKQIAHYAQSNTLTTKEIKMYNKTLQRLNEEIKILEQIYHDIQIQFE